jgi:hypothetical protein
MFDVRIIPVSMTIQSHPCCCDERIDSFMPEMATPLTAVEVRSVMDLALKDGACRCPGRLCRPAFGSMTFCPAPNIQSRYGIGGTPMPATDALEAIALWSISPIKRAASWTRLRGVLRTNRQQRDAGQCGLVGQTGPQLGKGPTMMRSALGLSKRSPFADALEVFEGSAALRVTSLPNDRLADPMVEIRSDPRFLAGALHGASATTQRMSSPTNSGLRRSHFCTAIYF